VAKGLNGKEVHGACESGICELGSVEDGGGCEGVDKNKRWFAGVAGLSKPISGMVSLRDL